MSNAAFSSVVVETYSSTIFSSFEKVCMKELEHIISVLGVSELEDQLLQTTTTAYGNKLGQCKIYKI